MASFITDLWTSVFTPGPTPTLLIATNATFAALQATLLALLIFAFNIHFLILSVLCAGLWAAINWFANELRIAQAEADAKARQSGEEGTTGTLGSEAGTKRYMEDAAGAKSTGSTTATARTPSRTRVQRRKTDDANAGLSAAVDTETEGEEGGKTPRRSVRVHRMRSQTPLDADQGQGQAQTLGASTSAQGAAGDVRRRGMEGSGYLSTDSEWEKVDGER